VSSNPAQARCTRYNIMWSRNKSQNGTDYRKKCFGYKWTRATTIHNYTHSNNGKSLFIYLLHFSHYRVFKNAHNSYPKISVKRPLASILVADEVVLYFCRWTLHLVFFVSFWCYLVNRILFPRCFKIIYRWSNLTNTIIIYLPCFWIYSRYFTLKGYNGIKPHYTHHPPDLEARNDPAIKTGISVRHVTKETLNVLILNFIV
jgi:hypothetical protein